MPARWQVDRLVIDAKEVLTLVDDTDIFQENVTSKIDPSRHINSTNVL